MADETPTPTAEPTREQLQAGQAQIQAALAMPAMRIYANGFMIAQTASDVIVILLGNGATTAVVNLSYISARSLLDELTKAVVSFEEATGTKIPSIIEVASKIEKHKGAPNAILG